MITLFMAILAVEGWRGPGTTGAAGEIGPYQITEAYWKDAGMRDGTFADCEGRAYSQRVMVRYWLRYCPTALRNSDMRTLAAVHHWGPRGFGNPAAAGDDYVDRVVQTERGMR
jgi:hypothetical protein